MAQRRTQPPVTQPDLSPERARAVLSTQLEKLQELKGRSYHAVKAAEDEWFQLTEKLVIRSFGSGSTNYRNFGRARSAGLSSIALYGGGIPGPRIQSNYEARLTAYEAALRSCLAELQLDLPDTGIRGVYSPGQEYEFYTDVKYILGTAQKEVFIIDPYVDPELFDVYADALPRTISFRLMSAKIPPNVLALAKKYVSGGNFQFKSSANIHDRVIFVDKRVWPAGQSLKDAAKKKPTYIVEHDESLMRGVYENIWLEATTVV